MTDLHLRGTTRNFQACKKDFVSSSSKRESWFLYKNILRKLLKVINSDTYLAYHSGLIRYIYSMTLNIFDTPKNLSLYSEVVTINKITIPPERVKICKKKSLRD